MILIDLNQVMLSNLLVSLGKHTNIKIEEDLLRHMILNSIRANRMKFKNDYGELVICCDSRHSWRREVFPFYKAHRKKAREQIDLDWPSVFKILDKITLELRENFPYHVIETRGAEADDIIAFFAHLYVDEPILILSGDKDFIQLHRNPNIKQYDPVNKKYIKHPDPISFLKEHIIRGDAGDGIPNILSDDDTFVANKRQKTLTENRFTNLMSMDEHQLALNIPENYKRNHLLIDLTNTPKPIREAIHAAWIDESGKDRSKLLQYFMNHKLKILMESLTDF